jgi:hypothetical protein
MKSLSKPRFRVRTLMIAGAVVTLTLGAWYWSTWPDLTAQTLVEHVGSGSTEAARRMCTADARAALDSHLAEIIPESWRLWNLLRESRPVSEVLAGRQEFVIPHAALVMVRLPLAAPETGAVTCRITIERGKVIRVRWTLL